MLEFKKELEPAEILNEAITKGITSFYVAYSGGKDSGIVLDVVAKNYPNNLPTQTFSEKISKCTYLCTACPTRSTYRVDRLCGTIVLAISHGIPLIIDLHLANLYNIPKETSIFYDPKTFDLSMLNTQTEQSYLKMTEAMQKFKEKCFGDQKEQWQLTKGTVYNTIRT